MKSYLIGSGALILALVVTFFASDRLDFGRSGRIHSRIQAYSDLVVNEFKKEKPNNDGPIQFLEEDKSHGLVGMDPWGMPYEYFIKQNNDSLTVILLSKGEDNIDQTGASKVKEHKSFSKSGDDYIFKKTHKI